MSEKMFWDIYINFIATYKSINNCIEITLAFCGHVYIKNTGSEAYL